MSKANVYALETKVARYLAHIEHNPTTVRDICLNALHDPDTKDHKARVEKLLRLWGWTYARSDRRWKKQDPKQLEQQRKLAALDRRIEQQKTIQSTLSYMQLADAIAVAANKEDDRYLTADQRAQRRHAVDQIIDELLRERFADRIFEHRISALEAQLRSEDD